MSNPVEPGEPQVRHLLEVSPRLVAWLDENRIPADMRTPFWMEGWAGEVFYLALCDGTADQMGPFLEATDELVRQIEPSAWDDVHGEKFVSHLSQQLIHGDRTIPFDPACLPPTLAAAWQDRIFKEDQHWRHDYGRT
jgi:hypothetical protein